MAFLGVYGHVNVDHILVVKDLPGPDQTVPIEKELMRLGGTAGNVARAAAALGVPTALASFVGDDFPEEFRQQLAASSIELVDLRKIPGPTPKIWILSGSTGAQSAVIDQGVMRDGLSRPTLDYTMLNSEWVHFTTGAPEEHLRLAKEAARLGKRVGFDPAQELSYRYPARLFEQFLDVTDLFIANEAEVERALVLLGYGDPLQLLDHADHVVVTRGAQGATLIDAQRKTEVLACPVRGPPPRDTVGAGDVFRAGLYAGLHAKAPLAEAARWGAVAASLFLESGAQRFPDRRALETRKAEWRR